MNSIPLSQAIERFSSAEDWAKYSELQKYRWYVLSVYSESPEDAKHFEFLRLRDRLEGAVCQKLSRGELIGSAMAVPLKADSQRFIVPAIHWSLLSIDFENSKAEGHGLSLIDITVGEPVSTPSPGRKPDAMGQRELIHKAFDELIAAGKVSFRHGGLADAVRQIEPKFPTYKPDSIRRIVQPIFKAREREQKKPRSK